jgi:hypothetical protein
MANARRTLDGDKIIFAATCAALIHCARTGCANSLLARPRTEFGSTFASSTVS